MGLMEMINQMMKNNNMKIKDWTGSKKCLFRIIGASNHSDIEREVSDYYATDPKAVILLLAEEEFSDNIWECACGEGHISKELEKAGYNVLSTDLHYRGYGKRNQVDFLNVEINNFDGDIITNPPYKYALEFAEKALKVISDGHKVAMFLKLTFLEGKKRKKIF